MNQPEIMTKLISKDWWDFSEAFKYFYESILPNWAVDKEFFPGPSKVFRAFNECSTDEVKVVILGQDPYHDGSATGLAFDNLRTQKKISPSLRNIRLELINDNDDNYGEINEARSEVYDSYLGHLPSQGVLLLNTALTVKPNEAGSHTEIWKPFTEQIIKDLQKKDNIVWILWGNHAKSFKGLISNQTHHIIEGVHPMPLAANRGGFFGEKYFSKANKFLTDTNQQTINW